MSHDPAINEELFHRVTMMIMSITLIVETLFMAGPLGWRVAFPLIAIYPGIAALIGWNLRPWTKMFGPDKHGAGIKYKNVHA